MPMLLWKEKVKSLLVLLFFLSLRKSVERLLPLQFLLNAGDKGRGINYLVCYCFCSRFSKSRYKLLGMLLLLLKVFKITILHEIHDGIIE